MQTNTKSTKQKHSTVTCTSKASSSLRHLINPKVAQRQHEATCSGLKSESSEGETTCTSFFFPLVFIAECVYTAFQVKVYVTMVFVIFPSFLSYCERSRWFSWDSLHPQPVQVHTKYNVTTEFKANVQTPLPSLNT